MSIEWTAPAVVLAARPYGEADAVVSVLTEAYGAHRGLVRGGASRRQVGVWQPGNLIKATWKARLPEQLGHMTGELVHPTAALAMDDRLLLLSLQSACAVADGALPEREPMPRVFTKLVSWLAQLGQSHPVPDLVRWELELLASLGYGLDLSRCAVTGATQKLLWVSPRTGRAVTDVAAQGLQDRLLQLPSFISGTKDITIMDLKLGLLLTEHFLARNAFGLRYLPLPEARGRLQNRF